MTSRAQARREYEAGRRFQAQLGADDDREADEAEAAADRSAARFRVALALLIAATGGAIVASTVWSVGLLSAAYAAVGFVAGTFGAYWLGRVDGAR